jgi:hypothetical protein
MDSTYDSFAGVWHKILLAARSRRFLLLSVLFPFFLRVIPEILAGPWPLGFDTVWVYAPFVKDVQTKGFGEAFSGVYPAAPLVFALLGIGAVFTGAPPFAITKAAAPLLYGFTGLSLYYFARRGLQWDQSKSLFLVLVTTLYFVPLRFSWDMYKNLLGCAFFLMALAHFRYPRQLRETTFLLAFAGLSILSSELTAALLGAIAGALFLLELVRDRRWNLPAFALLVIGGLATLFYIGAAFPATLAPSPLAAPPARSFFPYNYVGAAEDVYMYPTLPDVYATVLLLGGIVLGPLIPFAVAGFVRDRRMALWSGILATGAFSLLGWPFAAIPLWHRWLFMLTFPTLVFVTVGLLRVRRFIRAAFLVVVVILAATFLALPPQHAFPYYTNSHTTRYLQTSMMQNTGPLADSPDIVWAFGVLSDMRLSRSAIVANTAFSGWAKLYSQGMLVYEFTDPTQVERGNFSQYEHILMVYWSKSSSWFNAAMLPQNMVEFRCLHNVGLYEKR